MQSCGATFQPPLAVYKSICHLGSNSELHGIHAEVSLESLHISNRYEDAMTSSVPRLAMSVQSQALQGLCHEDILSLRI